MPHGAGCLCGAVRISIAADPLFARQCWCRLCQYLGAGSGTVNVGFAREAFTVEGEVRWHESTADSGNVMRRGFCPTCGTPIFSMADARPDVMLIRAGALDNPDLLGPQSVIWTSAAPKWACHDPALPHVAGQP